MAITEDLLQLQQPRLQPETKDVIGFDLGHGDTSVSRVPATGGRVQPLEVVKGAKIIATVVGTKQDGATIVGKDAFSDPEVSRPVQQFKSAHVDDPAVAGPLRSFVSGVMQGLKVINGTIPFDPTTLVVFGCPSAWDDEQKLSYGRLLAEQVTGMQVMLVPESRAAFITMKEEKQLAQNEIREPILIVDLGSSTTDFTFVSDLDPAELPIGKQYPLGASRIEQALVKRALDVSPRRAEIKAWWQQNPSEYHRTVFEFRRAKEEFFSAEAVRRKGRPQPVTVSYWISDTEPVKLEVYLAAKDFDATIDTPLSELGDHPVSWRDRLRTDLETASRMIHEKPEGRLKIVVLTGGAARMAFVEDVAKQVFPAPIAVRPAPEPEHAISIGLAQAGSIRYRTQEFFNEIDAIISSGKVSGVIGSGEQMKSFANATANAVATGVTERFILPEFLAWRSSDKGKLKDVTTRISGKMEAWLKSESGRQKILTALSPWYQQIERPLHEITAPICLKYKLDADALNIPKQVFDPQRPNANVNPDEVVFGTARLVMSAILATISFVTGAILFGAGTAVLLPTGPFAPIIAGLFMWLLGEATKEWLIEKVMDMSIPWLIRRMYPASWLESNLRNRATETEEGIRAEIIRSIVGGYPDDDPKKSDKEKQATQNQVEIVKKITAGIESALRQRADEASILIT